MRLRQEFIVVKAARLQLRAHKDNGDVLTLTWGNGDVEGNFLISTLGLAAEVMDGLGNLISATMTVGLMEVPASALLASKQAGSYKAAFAANPAAYTNPTFVAPPPYVRPPFELYVGMVSAAIGFAGMIDALSYGGQFPNLGRSLGVIMDEGMVNLLALQGNYSAYGSGYDMDDISTEITAAVTALTALEAIDPNVDPVGFGAANVVFQGAMVAVCF
jgi:hypothetical protein